MMKQYVMSMFLSPKVKSRKYLIVGFFLLLLLLLTGCTADPEPQPHEPDPDMWRLIWSDEFDGNQLDLSVWEIMTGTGAAHGLTGWGNYEAQYYHADNITVSDGFLRIEARHETRSSPGEGRRSYTSGRIRSTGTPGYGDGISVLYGRIEARIKLPVGYGLWPAFWMLPTNSPYGGWPVGGEIDIMEGMGRRPYRSTSAIHFGRSWPNNTHTHAAFDFPDGQSIADFNVYAIEWEPGEIRWFVNEYHFWTQTSWWTRHSNNAANFMNPAPFDQPFHILLNLAIGGWFDPTGTDNLDSSIFPVAMYVDYVRVYEMVGREMNMLPPATALGNSEFAKEPLPTGNIIWNGEFNQGPNGMIFWNTEPNTAIMSVTARDPQEHGINLPPFVRQLSVSGIDATTDVEDVALWQSYAILTNGTYNLAFDASAESARTIEVRLVDMDGIVHFNHIFDLGHETQRYMVSFDLHGLDDGTAMQVHFLFGGHSADVLLSGVELMVE